MYLPHQSIDFVVHTLDPWLVRIEKAIVKDLLMEDEKDLYFPKFNVDGLLRGDYKSRMDGYSVGISTGIISPNEARRKENMPPLPEEDGGDYHIVNGTFIKLKDVGQQYGVSPDADSTDKPDSEEAGTQDAPQEPDGDGKEEHENKRHTERHNQRKAERRGGSS